MFKTLLIEAAFVEVALDLEDRVARMHYLSDSIPRETRIAEMAFLRRPGVQTTSRDFPLERHTLLAADPVGAVGQRLATPEFIAHVRLREMLLCRLVREKMNVFGPDLALCLAQFVPAQQARILSPTVDTTDVPCSGILFPSLDLSDWYLP